MKKITNIVFVMVLALLLAGCLNQTTIITTDKLLTQEVNVESEYLADNVQDGTILHAWNWSMETIENHLEEIAIAGFSTVQISPMQPQKDYYGVGIWGDHWWKLYQPLGFSIATENHSLGTKEDLISLVNSANGYGIKIIVDVVLNHLAGDNNILDPNVATYEPLIYQQNLIRQDNGFVSDSSISAVVRGSLGGLPDLQTENQHVQDRVLSLLKEYVDVGVSGFRFDAAKHIETEEDGGVASDFWPYIINGVNEYAESLGKDKLYFYGEILHTPGSNREFTDYTEYMSITASDMSDSIRNGIISKNLTSLLNADYPEGVNAEKAVLWAESHDTYANSGGSTKNTPDSYITKAYVFSASRKDSTSLYFARPKENTFIGSIGSYLWQSLEIAEANRFHNYFIGADEYLYHEDGFLVNERYSSNKHGIVIINVEGAEEVDDIQVNDTPDGNYFDQISKSFFTVKNSKLSGKVSDSGIAIIYNNPYEPKPAIYVSDDGLRGSFKDTMIISAFSHNTTKAYYSLNNGEKIAFEGNIEIELSHPQANAIVSLYFELWYNDFKIEKEYRYIKSNVVVTSVTVNDINTDFLTENTKIVAWTWKESVEGKWIEGTYSNGTFVFDLSEGDQYFLLVIFDSAVTTYNWNLKIAQTNDVEIPSDGIYDGSNFVWN
ncbi:MAG: alpha-amylase family glycosyl hydrolase [Candidatus Izemoplasmatales bacterium]|nr:alpha-amylase family glycosyl hydrolase [Candidatus Izemoplasmatales bacterium]